MATKRAPKQETIRNQIVTDREPLRGGPPTKGPLVQRQIRMTDADWNRLKTHFDRKGLSISAGIRMIVLEYLEREEE